MEIIKATLTEAGVYVLEQIYSMMNDLKRKWGVKILDNEQVIAEFLKKDNQMILKFILNCQREKFVCLFRKFNHIYKSAL